MKISEYLKDYYTSNGNCVVLTTLRGKPHEIYLSDNSKYLYSYTGLRNNKNNNVLYLDWFDGIVDFIEQNGGIVKKGSCRNSKVGYGNCYEGTLCYYIATKLYGKSIGESSFDPVFIICAILDDLGICYNEYGYIRLANVFMNNK